MFEISNIIEECDQSCREMAVIESMNVFTPFLEGMDEYDDAMEGFFKAAGQAISRAIKKVKEFCKSIIDYVLGPKFVKYNKRGVAAIEKWNAKAKSELEIIAKGNADTDKIARFFDNTEDIKKELKEIMEKAADNEFLSEKGTIKSFANKLSENINANIDRAEKIIDGRYTDLKNSEADKTARGIITYCNIWLTKLFPLVKMIAKETRGTKDDRKQYRSDVKGGRDPEFVNTARIG